MTATPRPTKDTNMAAESKVTEPKSEVPEVKVTDPKTGPKAAAPKTPEAKTPEAKAEYIRAVYGRMVDPLTALEYTGVPSELYKRTGWVDSQLEAKKLELCDPPDQSTEG